MRSISIISKLTGVTNKVEASEITLNSPSIVELKAERSDIASIVRSSHDMIITLHDGEVITVKNFYAFADQGGNQLVLEDDQGALWWVQDTDSAFHFEHINNIDELMAATGAESHDGGAIWPWILGGVAVAGGIALAAGGGGGGGGGGDDNNSNNGGGNPNSPNQPSNGNDTTPPAAPTNLSVSADGKTITGNAEAGSTVTITDANGQVIGTGTADSNGNFSIPLTNPQISGEELTAHATDPAGNTGPDSSVTAPNIPLPDAPTLTNVVDDVTPGFGTIANNSPTTPTNDNTPTLLGAGQPGTTVHIYDNGTEIGTAVVDANGGWNFTPANALTDGSHSFTVTTINAKGESAHSDTYTVTIDTVAPDAPELEQLQDNVGKLTGIISSGTYTDETRPGLNGTGEVGDTVTIYDNGIQVGQATVGEDGKWSFTPDQPLADGSHQIIVVQTDAAGNVSSATTSPIFIVDHTPPAAAIIENVSLDGTTVSGTAEPGTTITITAADGSELGHADVDSDGNFTVGITPAQTHGETLTAHIEDQAGNVGPDTPFTASTSQYPTVPVLDSVDDNAGATMGILSNGQATDDTTPTLSGTAEAGSTVKIFSNGLLLDSVVADGTGHWTYTPSALADGPQEFTFTATNLYGTSGTSAVFTVNVDTTPPAAPGDLLVSQDGLHVTGSAEAGSEIIVTDSSGNVLGTGITGADGRFDVSPLTSAQTNGEPLLVSATDSADNKSDNSTVFAQDSTPPGAPTNVDINDEGSVVTGDAEPGSTVNVTDSDGTPLGTGTAGSDGSFSIPIFPPQTAGEKLEVSATDNAGNTGPETPITAPDTTAPDAPVISAVVDDVPLYTTDHLSDGQTTNDDKPQLKGTAEAGATVKIYDNATLLNSVTADEHGNWSYTPTTALAQGLHNLTVTATDAKGNVSPEAAFSLTVDSIAPQAPTITLVSDDFAPVSGSVPNNGFTNDRTPTISGTGEPGSVVTLFDGATALTTFTVGVSGTWSYTPSTLIDSTHRFTVSATDAAGNTTAPSAEYVITIDITAPSAPTIDGAVDNVGTVTATLANNSATDDTLPQFNGSGPAGSTVTLYDGPTAIGSIVVDGDGKWSIIPTQPLSEGPHTITAVATDAAGNASPAASFNLTVDTTPPVAPSITNAQGEVGGIPATVTNGGSTQNGTPTLTGSGEVGATIKIYDNGGSTPIGSVTVPAGGIWTFTPSPALAEGSHSLTAVATDPAGNVGLPSAGFTLNVDSTPPAAPGTPTVTDDHAPVVGTVSNGGSTNDTTPTFSGTGGTAGDKIEVFNGSTKLGETTVRADGSWGFTPTTPLTEQVYNVTVKETDAAGNVSPPSAAITFTVDTTASAAPVIVNADDNVGAVQQPLFSNAVTDDNTPTFHGTGANGDIITLYNGTTVLGSTTVVGTNWTITLTSPLPNGALEITATATDAAGNLSPLSAIFNLTVDNTPLTAPVVTEIADDVGVITTSLVNGSYTDDTSPVFSGTGKPGSTITVLDNGTPVVTSPPIVTVAPDGTWSFTTTLPTGVSDHTFTFSASDATGNTAVSPNPITLHVDTLPPDAPLVSSADPNGTLVNGTAEPGSTVIIRDANTHAVLGRGLADSTTGTFSVTISPAQTTAEELEAIAQDAAGNQSGPTGFIAADTNVPHPPTIEVLDDVAPVTGRVDSGASTNDNLPTLSGVAEDGAMITLYIDGIAQTPFAAGTGGAWSYQFTTPLADGPHTFAVSQSVGGVSSGQTPNFNITVDTLLPTAPAITSVTDDVAPVTGIITSGQATNDQRPTFTGTGEVGSTITILDGTTTLGTATVTADGTWTFTPPTNLAEGPHTITVTATDAVGNVSAPPASFSLIVDTSVAAAPVITSVVDDTSTPGPVVSGQPTNDNTPTFNGTADPNSTLTISENGTVIGTVPVNGAGNWTFTPATPLADGSHNLTLVTTDAAGNVSPPATFTAVVDTAAPVVPAITLVVDDQTQPVTNLTNGQLTRDTQPTLSGTSEANATINVYSGDTLLGTTTATGTGTWSFTPDAGHQLLQGNNTLTVKATDAAGNISNSSAAFSVVVDSVAPTAPAILTVTDNTAPNIGPITSGQPTNETRPAITGSGEVGSTITVYDGITPLGTATVGAGGTWSFTPPSALPGGSHNLTVTATDPAGNVSAPSAAFNVVIDTTAPVAPAITTVADDAGTVTGNLTNGQVTDDTRPQINGTVEAGSTVNIYDNGTLIGTAIVTGGTWSFTPPAGSPLANGNHAFTVTATDSAGNVSPASGAFNIVVDTAVPTAPIVIQATDDVGPVTGALVNGQSTNDNQPLLSGTAEANSTVKVYDDGILLGTTTASAEGIWSLAPPNPLPDRTHVFTATSTDAAGNVGAISGSFTLTIDTVLPTTPVLTSVVDDVAGFNGSLSNGQITNDARPTLNGTGEPGSTLAIFDGAIQIGTVTVPASGTWTFTPATPLATGAHTFTLTATDAAGNVTTPTPGFTITLDTSAPNAPLITTVVDDVGTVTGPVANNQTTNDTLPTLNGTAEAGATVAIYDNGNLVTSVTADGSGNWTYPLTTALTEGNHTFTVTATDLAGNTSANSLPAVIIVDTTPPAAPTGMVVNATGTTVTGNAEAGSTVTISSGGTVLGSATADGNGKFSVTITPAQTNGESLQAAATDSAGNLGASAGFAAPNTALPGVPVITTVLDNFAPVTGTVNNGQSTNDATPTINGTADIGATVSIYNNGVLMGSVVATDGTWSYTPSALTEGSHAFTATATNPNGTGSPSTALTVIVDTIAPLTPTATISADGTTISGSAEANSTVNITLPDGTVVTTTANGSGSYTLTLPTREIGGEQLSVTATDAAGNTSPSVTATAPTLPLAADDNVVNLALTSSAVVSPPEHYSDYGVLLVGALGDTVQVLGNDTAQVGFTVNAGGTANITIDAAATGVVLTLLNTMEVVIQQFVGGAWTTVIDSRLPQFANLLTLGASGVTLNVTGLEEGTYRVLSYNTSLLATGSFTSLDVSIEQISGGTVSGETTHPGNVITDIDPNSGQDTAPTGTVVTSVTNSQGVTTQIGAGGADITGEYGTLHINQDGSYTYTLTDTSASVLGSTENFTYTITHNGVSDSAQLVVTLGNPTPASTVTATDNTAALTYNTDVEAVDHGASQQSGFSVLSVGVGNVLSLSALANMANPILFDVDEGSTRTMTLQASVGGVALLSTFDLYVYKFNDVTQQYEQYRVVNTWLTAPLLGGTSSQLTLTLPGGEYLFLLKNASGVAALTGYTLNILQDHTYAVESVTASTSGNVMNDDIHPVDSHITQVNGVAIAASGTTTIVGEYGTLTIDAAGNYTYKLNSGLGADSIKTPDSFVYTITAPNGDTDTASLNVTATPHTVDAFDDSSTVMAVNTAQNTAVYSDTSVGSASWTTLVIPSSGSGNGTFAVGANEVLHNPVLHFTVQSLLSLGGLNVDWNITNSSGTVVRNGSFSGGILLGGVANIDLAGLDLQSGTYTLNYTGRVGVLGAGQITITPTITGTTIDLDSYSTLAGNTVHGNIYDGTEASGAADQLGTVHTLLSITGFNGTTTTLDPLTSSNSTATIQGHYGTLVMGIDGAYTYTLNSGLSPASMTTKETFTYTLNDQNGHSDSATLTINMSPQFVSTAQSDVITGSAYGDTLIYHLLTSASATGGNSADTWHNFSAAQGDTINVHDLLTGWNGQAATLGNYLNVTTSGNNTVISIDRDGTGGTYNSTTLVTLENTHVTLDELVQQHHIIT